MRTEDGSIIYECLNGKPEAFGILVDKYKAGIYAFVCAEVRNFHDAEDVTQEVFIQAYRGLRSLRRWESFAFWLYRIAHARCADLLRVRSKRVDRELIGDQDPGIVDVLSLGSYRESQINESVREALDSLPDAYRQVLILHYFGGMTIKDIARAIGTSPGAIGMRLSRARAQLKEEMVSMMDTAFEGQRLQANFTFRIVEAVKRIKINPAPRMTGLPWGLSLAAGVMLLAMTIGSQMAIQQSPELTAFPSEITPEVREMSVDILGSPGTSIIVGNQGNTDGGRINPRDPQKSFLMAPAAGGGTWTQKADMLTAKSWPSAAVVDGRIYVFGGYINNVTWATTTAVEEYNPATDTWTIKADMPTTRAGLSANVVNGIIYAIGGGKLGELFSIVEAYDPAADKWTKKASMPTIRDTFADGVVDGKIYIIGGHTWVGMEVATSTVEVYDPATDKWTRKADMPTARRACAACVMDGRIYVFGGRPDCVGGPQLATVEVYDPATDTWTKGSDMPRVRSSLVASVVDGKMYIIGGDNPVDVYDPGTDKWTTAASLPAPRSFPAAVVVDGRIYVIGGASGGELHSTVYEYDPGLPNNIAIISPAGKLQTTWGEVKSE